MHYIKYSMYLESSFVLHRFSVAVIEMSYGGRPTASLTKNKHVCALSQNYHRLKEKKKKKIYASYSKLSKELKNGIDILVSQTVFSYGSKQSK